MELIIIKTRISRLSTIQTSISHLCICRPRETFAEVLRRPATADMVARINIKDDSNDTKKKINVF